MLRIIHGLDAFTSWCNQQYSQGNSQETKTFDAVDAIRRAVLADGDTALCAYTNQFDGADVVPNDLRVPDHVLDEACDRVSPDFLGALKRASANIEEFHMNQRPSDWERSNDHRRYGVQHTPLDAVGLYVPGGRAAYPSSVLMAAIPAKIAGCPRVVMVSPPSNGGIPDSVLAAAKVSGVHEVYQVGGAQAVFALSYGTRAIQPVDKIVGPGNKFVTLAKQMVYGTVDIDKPAGPSEVCVVMDDAQYATFAASELLAQLEHDPDASAIALVVSEDAAQAVTNAFNHQLPSLSRANIIEASKKNAVVAIIRPDDVVPAINTCASEHLVLISKAADQIRTQVRHAGSIFCGPYTPVALGDYYAGPNHVLPTGRSARFASPLGVMDYMKFSSHLTYTRSGLQAIASDLDHLTHAEGFDAHFQSVQVRLND